jgi:hypothetical protein
MYENNIAVKQLIPALCAALFICCMVCHGELAQRKPHPRYLTQFYLMVALGGAIGGLFVALAAPRLFRSYLELPLGLLVCAVLVTCVLWNRPPDDPGPLWLRIAMVVLTAGAAGYAGFKAVSYFSLGPQYRWSLPAAATVGSCVLVASLLWNEAPGRMRPLWVRAVMLIATAGFAGYLGSTEVKKDRAYVLSARNFYGTLRVRDDVGGEYSSPVRVLVHGTINHGTQLLRPGGDRIATSYFGRNSGISRAIRALGDSGPVRIGILGLGAGVTATLARAGDTLHYYEINPLVVQIANTQFGFFRACPADKQLFLGDGRLVLESLPSEQLDFLAMDAFTSDAVPVHLLTKEAYGIYQRHLKPNGVLAINISNRYLDLEPVIGQAAWEMGWSGVTVADDGEDEDYYTASTWVLMSRSRNLFDHPNFKYPTVEPLQAKHGFRPWTDDYSNIIQILK